MPASIKYLVASLLLISLLPTAGCAKILMLVTSPARSHLNVFLPLIQELSNRNHTVTVLAHQRINQLFKNVKILQLAPPPILSNSKAMNALIMDSINKGLVAQMWSMTKDLKDACEGLLKDETTQTLIEAGRQFDLVIVDSLFDDCALPLAYLLGNNVIRLYGCAWWPWKATSLPTPPSFVPNYFDHLTSHMSFWKRLKNAALVIGMRLVYKYSISAAQQEVLHKYLPHAPTVEEAEAKVALSLTNADPVMTSPRPSMPNSVNCGPLHCKKHKPLTEELNSFVESSGKDGFILFALGTTIESENLPPEFQAAVISTFSRLKQKVIWKFESKLENLPQNVKIMPWLPQQDLLGHPKARLFISHAGLLSLQETIFHGVPVIGIPFWGDQRGNIARVEELEIGVHLNICNVTGEGFYEIVNKVLHNRRYYDTVKKYSRIIKNQPDIPLNRAVFWIEYVIRHEGAHHLRSAGDDLSFFQYFMLDVTSFILVITTTILIVFIYLINQAATIWRKLCRKDVNKKRK